MPGHDRTRIVGQTPKQLEEFTCGICHDVLNHPLATQCCRQSYCKDCIEEWLKGHITCPNDRKLLTRAQLLEVPRLVLNLINDMRMKCVFRGKGCPSVHTISEESVHTLKCEFNECTKCGHRGDKTGHNCIKCLLHKCDRFGQQIKCLFSGRGWPSVHSIGEDPQHMKVCDYNQSKVCGFSDANDDHKCLTHLTEENIKLKSDLDELSKKFIKDMTDLKKENAKLKRDLEIYRDTNRDWMAIPSAIKNARWRRPLIEKKRGSARKI